MKLLIKQLANFNDTHHHQESSRVSKAFPFVWESAKRDYYTLHGKLKNIDEALISLLSRILGFLVSCCKNIFWRAPASSLIKNVQVFLHDNILFISIKSQILWNTPSIRQSTIYIFHWVHRLAIFNFDVETN